MRMRVKKTMEKVKMEMVKKVKCWELLKLPSNPDRNYRKSGCYYHNCK
jgi:hypothetical protein